MTRLFEFADSEISRIEALPAGLVIRFAAAMLRVPEANEALSSFGEHQWDAAAQALQAMDGARSKD